jgi:nucleoside phosphorylase
MPSHTHPRDSYNVGIICALDVEKAAVEATLDEEHVGVEKLAGDDNVYSFGRIGVHNVVIACLPAGVMGKASATAVAKDMMRSFPIKAGLMVGICGGVWSEKTDVRLGDVIVSQPDGMHGGVVQWDYGKMEKDGVFRRTGTLNKPPRPLLGAVQALKAKHRRKGSEVPRHLEEMLVNNPVMAMEYGHQGQEHDELFEASYSHPSGDTCDQCDRSRLVQRLPKRKDDQPKIHYGNIASGDEVVKDGPTRDRIAKEEGILCFEMEAAGLMDAFPCVVIRGVCDYADSHKNKRWQPYASAMAACYAKELLGVVERQGIEELGLASE